MKRSSIEKPKNILCCIDYGKNSYYLAEYAYKLSRFCDSGLYLLHIVTDFRRTAGFYVPHINTDKLESDIIKAARDKMYALCEKVIGDVPTSHRLVEQGHPMEVVNKIIKDKKIDLLILGYGMSKGTLSSFKTDYAGRFLKNPTCPFLVVPFREA